MTELPDPATFLSGEAGRGSAVGDLWLDARLLLSGERRKLDRVDVPAQVGADVFPAGPERVGQTDQPGIALVELDRASGDCAEWPEFVTGG